MLKAVRIATLLGALLVVGAILVDFDAEQDLRIAGLAFRAGDLDQSLRFASRALLFGGLDPAQAARAHAFRAQAALKLGRPDYALTELDLALGRDADRMDLLILRGELRLKTGDRAGALADLDKAVARAAAMPKASPAQLSKALVYRGQAFLAMGRLDRALVDARRAAALDPASPLPLLLSSRVLDAQGHPGAALEQAEAAFALLLKRPRAPFTRPPETENLIHWLIEMRRKNKVGLNRAPRGPQGP